MELGGTDGPQYSPMIGALFKSPSKMVKVSMSLELKYLRELPVSGVIQ